MRGNTFLACAVPFQTWKITGPTSVVFFSCPLVKKHANLLGSFLYSQSTMKDMYSKPTNRTELSIPMNKKKKKKPCVAANRRTFGKGNDQNVPKQLDLESSFTFKNS